LAQGCSPPKSVYVSYIMQVLSLFFVALAANPNEPHAHQGILPKYDRKPPKEMGFPAIKVPVEDLRQGSPLLRRIQVPGGFTRSVSVQDVHAPESTVWKAINDLPRYPKMVDGVVGCQVYSKSKEAGCEVTCATYKLKAAGMSMEYYMKHIFEPKKHSMTFHLDYDRCSDFNDSVGYWFVEDQKDGWCRVYYSADSNLPSFVPGFMKDAILKKAAKRSTSWVDKRCNELTSGAALNPMAAAANLRAQLQQKAEEARAKVQEFQNGFSRKSVVNAEK